MSPENVIKKLTTGDDPYAHNFYTHEHGIKRKLEADLKKLYVLRADWYDGSNVHGGLRMSPEDIAKIADWMGLTDVQAGPKNVTYRPWVRLSNRIRFNPIEDPADAWRVLEHCIAQEVDPDFATSTEGDCFVKLVTVTKDEMRICDGHGKTPAEALCAAVRVLGELCKP